MENLAVQFQSLKRQKLSDRFGLAIFGKSRTGLVFYQTEAAG